MVTTKWRASWDHPNRKPILVDDPKANLMLNIKIPLINCRLCVPLFLNSYSCLHSILLLTLFSKHESLLLGKKTLPSIMILRN